MGLVIKRPSQGAAAEMLPKTQWRSEAKCCQGPTIKVPPFPPFKFAYKNLK